LDEDRPIAKPVPTQNSTTQKTSMLRAGFEPMISVFKRPLERQWMLMRD